MDLRNLLWTNTPWKKGDYQGGVSHGSGSVLSCVLALLAFLPRWPDMGTGAGTLLKHPDCGGVVETKPPRSWSYISCLKGASFLLADMQKLCRNRTMPHFSQLLYQEVGNNWVFLSERIRGHPVLLSLGRRLWAYFFGHSESPLLQSSLSFSSPSPSFQMSQRLAARESKRPEAGTLSWSLVVLVPPRGTMGQRSRLLSAGKGEKRFPWLFILKLLFSIRFLRVLSETVWQLSVTCPRVCEKQNK